MPTISLSSGKTFQSDAAESILDAAMRSQVTMAYSCRTGRCNSCKAKLISGESRLAHDEIGLSAAEKGAGWVLSCARVAQSDVMLEVEDFGGVILPPVKTLACKIDALETLAPDVIKVMLRMPPSTDFKFLPGQYIEVIAQDGLRRSYSIASANPADKRLELHIRAVPDGAMSDYWFNHAKTNDLLRLNGPLGTFFLREAGGLDLIFLATGTGIAPIKAILEGMTDVPPQNLPRSISVYWGGRTRQDLYCDLTPTVAGQKFIPVLSRADDAWSGARGYIQNAFLATNPDLSKTVIYACGSDAMIHSARDALTRAGLAEQHFHSDAFVCSAR